MYVYNHVPAKITEPVEYVNPSSSFFYLLHNVLTTNMTSHHSPMVQPMKRHGLAKEDLIDGYAQVNFPFHHF